MPQSLHILSAHIFFRPKSVNHGYRQPFGKEFGPTNHASSKTWNGNSITIAGVGDHVHVLCNLTKKFPTAKVLEILKKDSSKLVKTLGVPDFHWQDGYRPFQCKPVALRSGKEIHSRPRRASQTGDVPAGISADYEKYRAPYVNDMCGVESLGYPVRADSPLHNFPMALRSAMMVQARRPDDLDQE